MPDDTSNVFLLSCDKRIEKEVQALIGEIQMANGRIRLKTMDNVPEVKGDNFSKKLDGILNWAKAVLIICSDNLPAFLDKKDTSNCTDIIVSNDKDSIKVIKKFIEKQMKTSPNKMVLLSLSENALPQILKGATVITKGDKFIQNIVAGIEGK